MERISVFGRSVSLLILILFLSGCVPHKTPELTETTPFLKGSDYVMLIDQREIEEIIEEYSHYFAWVESKVEHEQGVSYSFWHNGNPYNFTIVPNDITSEGGWAIFIVNPL